MNIFYSNNLRFNSSGEKFPVKSVGILLTLKYSISKRCASLVPARDFFIEFIEDECRYLHRVYFYGKYWNQNNELDPFEVNFEMTESICLTQPE